MKQENNREKAQKQKGRNENKLSHVDELHLGEDLWGDLGCREAVPALAGVGAGAAAALAGARVPLLVVRDLVQGVALGVGREERAARLHGSVLLLHELAVHLGHARLHKLRRVLGGVAPVQRLSLGQRRVVLQHKALRHVHVHQPRQALHQWISCNFHVSHC